MQTIATKSIVAISRMNMLIRIVIKEDHCLMIQSIFKTNSKQDNGDLGRA